MTDEAAAPTGANDRERELGAILADVDVSAPSVSKFDRVRDWAARIVGDERERVCVYYVSKAGNLDVRFRQPGVERDRPRLAIALIPPGEKVSSYLKPARRNVDAGRFEAFVVCEGRGGDWHGLAAFRSAGSAIDATLGGLVAAADVTEVDAPLVAPAGGTASPAATPSYDLARFTEETGLSDDVAREWTARLRRKGQIVIEGPPGTGKTWVAERLARLVVGTGRGVTDTLQFHPAWSYEDFVAGIAPVVRDGALAYESRPGRLLEFCELADQAGGDPCVLVVDEFNRADLPRVFGELMHMLDYRGKEMLLSSGPDDGRFALPANVFMIATMNTADRSTALLDHALRRRFSFVRLAPNYDVLARRLTADGLDPSPLIDTLRALNDEIADPDYEIGISFFMGEGTNLPGTLPSIWDGEVMPYVREILHATPDAVRRWSWDQVEARFDAWPTA